MGNTMVQEKSAGEGLKLEVSRVIKASRPRVYSAWTNPELLKQWFAPGAMTPTEVSLDPRPGGAYRIEMRGPQGGCDSAPDEKDRSHVAVATGVYKELIPNERIRFTWRGDWRVDEETLVTITLKDAPGGTEVTILHERFTLADSRDGHQKGWTSSLEKLATFCEN